VAAVVWIETDLSSNQNQPRGRKQSQVQSPQQTKPETLQPSTIANALDTKTAQAMRQEDLQVVWKKVEQTKESEWKEKEQRLQGIRM